MIPRKHIALIFFAALASAPAIVLRAQGHPDSEKSPWQLPFSVSFSASVDVGSTSFGYDQKDFSYDIAIPGSGTSGRGIAAFQIRIDTTLPNTTFSLQDSTLTYTANSTINGGSSTLEISITDDLYIVFNHNYDSIISFSYSHDSSGSQYFRHTWDYTYSLSLSGLHYDSSAIICLDTILSSSNAQYSERGTETESSQWQTLTGSDSVLWISLGGIFRPITLFIPAAVSMSTRNSDVSLQSYPNPFSQSSTILFTSETSGYADISLVNLLGAEVTHLFSGELAAGEHSFVWSNPGLPEGTYECLIRFNGQVQTLPMVLMH
jgi:hypothetical protein